METQINRRTRLYNAKIFANGDEEVTLPLGIGFGVFGSPPGTRRPVCRTTGLGLLYLRRWRRCPLQHIPQVFACIQLPEVPSVDLKAGSVMSSKGQVFDLAASLLPLLEPMSAARWTCPYFKLPFNLSWINWIITVNDHRSLSAPLLSRCPPIHVPYPTRDHLVRFAGREGQRRDLSDTSIEAIGEALTRAMKQGYQPDLRVVLRMLDLAEDLENRPTLH